MSTQFKFLHAADLHLDTPFSGLSKLDEDIADELRNASIRAFEDIVETAVRNEVKFVVFAGDIYDGAERGLRSQLIFQSGLERLADAGIEAFVIHGNHDPLDGWSLIRAFPPNTHVFGEAYEAVPVERDGELIAMIHGVSYGQNHVHENLMAPFRPEGDCFQIGLLHTEVDNPSSDYAPCSLDDLINSGMDYWALGHIHKRQVLCNDPMVVYPGNHQGRSFNEQGARGVSIVTVRDGRIADHAFEPVDRWRFETVTVNVDFVQDVAELSGLVLATIEQSQGGRARIARVRLEGRSPVHDDLVRESTEGLLGHIRDSSKSFRPRVWVARIEDRTRASFDIEEVRERDDFASEVVRISDDWSLDALDVSAVPQEYRSSLKRFLADQASPPDEVIAEARDLAVELLLHQGDA